MNSGLAISGLHKRFGDVRALSGVDLHVDEGQLIGFLGPNGAGKTTTMRAILGLTSLDAGTISWNGRPISVDDRAQIGYMPQERGLYPGMRVHEHIAYIGRLAGLDNAVAKRRANEWAERVGLDGRSNDAIQELSTGNQQRVQLAVALVHEPKLLVLDEPFAGLDPVAVAMLSDVMTEQVQKGVSVVFSSHQLELVQDLAENVTIIADGKTQASGRVTELRAQSPYRLLDIVWSGPAPDFSPIGATELPTVHGTRRWQLLASSDPGSIIAEAAQAGAIASVSYQPPGLEDVFLELVSS